MDKKQIFHTLRALRKKAEAAAKDPELTIKLVENALAKAHLHKDSLHKVVEQFQGLLRLVKAYATGAYRKLPWPSLLMAIGAILYFLNPFDMIPDFIAGVGYLDDATVIGFVLKAIQHDVQEFLSWEKR